MKSLLALAFVWLLQCATLCQTAVGQSAGFQSAGLRSAGRPPNIVLIMADDLGWRDLGCYGSTYHQTPNLDRLASRGVRFTQAYAANPLCSPTRSSLLTGLWPARIGITAPVCHLPKVVLEKKLAPGNPNQKVLVAESVSRLKTDYVTLPKQLHAAGYRTGHFGKWHLGAEPYSPLQHGFDVDFPHWPGPGPAGSYVAPWRFPADLKVERKPGEHIEDLVSQNVVQFIRDNKDHPLFVNYWQFSVHAPYDAKEELVAKYRKSIDPKNPQRNPVYAAMVHSLDEGVGRVLNALDECGLSENTVIVFTSDNGGVSWNGTGKTGDTHKSERFQSDMQSPPTSNLPLRNGKASLYEGGVREPCLVVWPGVTRAGTTNDTIVQSIDWMPTLLEIVGVSLPVGYQPDGKSLVPVFKGQPFEREAIFTHFPHDTPASGQHPGTSVRRKDWKLIRLYGQQLDGSDQLELYNLKDDLGETKDVASSHPELVKELNALIDRFLQETDAVVPKRNPNYRPSNVSSAESPKTKDRLEGLVPRGCNAVIENGSLKVTVEKPGAFIAFAAGKSRGAATYHVRMKPNVGGVCHVECLPTPTDRDQAKRVSADVKANEWNEKLIELPNDFPLGIVRLYLPDSTTHVEIDWIEFKPSEGGTRRWDF